MAQRVTGRLTAHGVTTLRGGSRKPIAARKPVRGSAPTPGVIRMDLTLRATATTCGETLPKEEAGAVAMLLTQPATRARTSGLNLLTMQAVTSITKEAGSIFITLTVSSHRLRHRGPVWQTATTETGSVGRKWRMARQLTFLGRVCWEVRWSAS